MIKFMPKRYPSEGKKKKKKSERQRKKSHWLSR